MFPGMLTLLRFIGSLLVRRFRSPAVLELENLALRHQLHVLRRQRPGRPRLFVIDRLLWAWLPIVAALSGGDGLGQAGNGDPMAPSGGQITVPNFVPPCARFCAPTGDRSLVLGNYRSHLVQAQLALLPQGFRCL
jgi:hypothetical protein